MKARIEVMNIEKIKMENIGMKRKMNDWQYYRFILSMFERSEYSTTKIVTQIKL